MKQEDEVTAKVEADQALVKKKIAEWKAIMEGMSFNAFLQFHSKKNELMKTKKATLVKYGFLAQEMLDNRTIGQVPTIGTTRKMMNRNI